MGQLIQAAMEAAQQGNKRKAVEVLREALRTNPNETEAWLLLSRLVDQPDRKRQCLNRVLALDASNKIAREELLKLDRAALGASPARLLSVPPFIEPAPAFVSSPITSPVITASPADPIFSASTPVSSQAQKGNEAQNKPLVFKFPLFWRIGMYLFLILFTCVGLLIASENVINSLPFLGLALLMGLTAMAFSPKVEITEAGIRATGTFSSSEIQWNEITRIQSSAIKRRLELFRNNGESVKVSTQVSGYPQIVEILRQKRPDLFDMPSASLAQGDVYSSRYEQTPSSIYGGSGPAFSGTKTFKKNFFAKFGVILLMIPLCLVAVWLIAANKDYFAGIGVGLVALFFMGSSLFAIHIVKVETSKLSTESFFGEKEFTAAQIKNISMKTVRSRRGVANNFVQVELIEGSAFSLGGFPQGDEVMYGFLMNWWNTYRNK